MIKKVIILHNPVLTDKPDVADVINQRELVREACEKLGYEVACLATGHDLPGDIESLIGHNPDAVFNLVEEAWGRGELIYLVPALLNAHKIPYTGVPLDALFLTTNKVLAKRIMRLNNIPTADFFQVNETYQLDPEKTYIVKPVWEEASVGITADSIFRIREKEKLERISGLPASHYFIEEYIDGREFNISMLACEIGVEVLPPAEMIFSGFYAGKPKIVDYSAKWDEGSPEFGETNRVFDTLIDSPALHRKLMDICSGCWEIFNLKGYARVDLRVNNEGRPYVLEINGNPCISPDSGFVAAVKQAGYQVRDMIDRILQDLN